MNNIKKYKVGLVIGRFQPFHKGHHYLIKEGLKIAESVIIGIGSANVSDMDNPYSIEVRQQTLYSVFKKEMNSGQIEKIVPLDDDISDDVWLEKLFKKTGKIDVVIGNNDRVKGIMEAAGYKTLPIKFYKREIYEGKKIREKLRKKNLL